LTLGSSPRFDCASQSPAWDGPTPALRTGEPSPDPHAYRVKARMKADAAAERIRCVVLIIPLLKGAIPSSAERIDLPALAAV
jgi:hypothetical protein